MAEQGREIIRLVAASDVVEFELVDGDLRLRVAREPGVVVTAGVVGQPVAPLPEVTPAPEEAPVGQYVTAPVVGWFRRTPVPQGSAPFVEPGQAVKKGQTLAIIEAVQVVHEVQAPGDFVVAEVLVDDGVGVEFGQQLFRLTPVAE